MVYLLEYHKWLQLHQCPLVPGRTPCTRTDTYDGRGRGRTEYEDTMYTAVIAARYDYKVVLRSCGGKQTWRVLTSAFLLFGGRVIPVLSSSEFCGQNAL